MGSSTSTSDRATLPPDPLAAAEDSTRLSRRARAVQLDEVHAVVVAGSWHRHGFRSPLAWLASTTSESPGVCAVTLELAERIQHIPIVKDRFQRGALAESALRLLSRAWHPDIADVFTRDEQMLVGWALNLAHRDFKMVLDTCAACGNRSDPVRCVPHVPGRHATLVVPVPREVRVRLPSVARFLSCVMSDAPWAAVRS